MRIEKRKENGQKQRNRGRRRREWRKRRSEGEEGCTNGYKSQQQSEGLTVKQTDRTPPKVKNASMYQTHIGAKAGCTLSASTGCRKPSIGTWQSQRLIQSPQCSSSSPYGRTCETCRLEKFQEGRRVDVCQSWGGKNINAQASGALLSYIGDAGKQADAAPAVLHRWPRCWSHTKQLWKASQKHWNENLQSFCWGCWGWLGKSYFQLWPEDVLYRPDRLYKHRNSKLVAVWWVPISHEKYFKAS